MLCLLLCDVYIEIVILVRLAIMVIDLGFLNFGVVGCTEVVLHVGPFCLATSVSCGGHSNWFLEFWVLGFPVYLEK